MAKLELPKLTSRVRFPSSAPANRLRYLLPELILNNKGIGQNKEIFNMEKANLKYMIIGTGGTGGPVGAYLAKAGKDVTFIARGKHLEAMKENGLRVIRPDDEFTVYPVNAVDMDHCTETPDVIFVCVKGYSIGSVVPFIEKVATPDTVVIPILNIYGTGGELQKLLPNQLVTDGCIYVAAMIGEPGVITMKGDILRIIFGVRNPEEYSPVLKTIESDLNESGILGVLSDNIRRDALLKFSYVSPQGACGLFYNVAAGEIQKPGEIRECFKQLVHEIDILANAMDIHFEEDIVERNLKILDNLSPAMTTSLQRDIDAGGKSELEGLIYRPAELAGELGIELPIYEKIGAELRKKGIK